MKYSISKVILLFSMLTAALFSNAQATGQEQDFLNFFFEQYRPKIDTFYYSSNLSAGELQNMKESLKRHIAADNSAEETPFGLQCKDFSVALSAIDSLQKISWHDRVIEKGRLVPEDTLTVLYKKMAQDQMPLDVFGGEIHSFSHPIFLRKGTICLFYHGSFSSPMDSYGCFYVYKKVEDSWCKLGTLFAVIS